MRGPRLRATFVALTIWFPSLAAASHPTHPAILPAGFTLEPILQGLTMPTAVAFAPAEDGRVFFIEQHDPAIRVMRDGVVDPEPFAVIEDLAIGPRKGMLGLAVDPLFAENGYVYLVYTEDLGGGGPPPLEPTWVSIQANVFEGTGCAECHAGASPPGGLRLEEDHSYEALVGVPSAEVPTRMRVAPGDPAGSYLLAKLRGDPDIVGKPMPPYGGLLDAEVLSVVEAWIAAGAPRGEGGPAPAPLARNRVVRLTDDGTGHGVDAFVLIDDIPVGDFHNSGPVEATADGMVYAQTGENFLYTPSQDPASLAGKILRVRRDGSIPEDNPFAGVPGARPEIFSLGHRNGFGIAPDPIHTGPARVYVTENGPRWIDEVNIVSAGTNTGWPQHLGAVGAPGFADPIFTWYIPVGPTGLVRYDGDAYPAEYYGDLFVGHFNAPLGLMKMQRFELDASGSKVERATDFLITDLGGTGWVLDVAQSPDGVVWLTTGAGIYRIAYGHGDRDADGCEDAIDPSPSVFSADADGDGFGADCDCDDGNAGIHPGATEIADNGIDEDCDPSTPPVITCAAPLGAAERGASPPYGALLVLSMPLAILVAARLRRGGRG